MPLKTKHHEQFIVLMAGDTDPTLLKHHPVVVATRHSDILMHIEKTQFDLILLDLTAAPVQSRCSELIERIKAPLGVNKNTPVIAIINPGENSQGAEHYGFDDSLIKPITEERLNEMIDFWQTNALALDYIQLLLGKTKNNQQLALTIFEKLFNELPLQLVDIKNTLDGEQYGLAKETTHKLNGSAGFCGLVDIQQSAGVLEKCLLSGNYTDIHQHFLPLQQSILNFTRHQKFILARLKAMG